MALLKVKGSSLKGSIALPPSKSHSMRAILFGSLGQGRTKIYNVLKSPDILSMIQAFRQFGVQIDLQEEYIEIEGVDGELNPCENVIDAGNSGQVLRFVGSLAALLPSYTIITGDHSIRHNRPMQPLLSALSQLKAFAVSSRSNGMAPIVIRGPMQPGRAELMGEDSQPVSALLMAASFLKGTTLLKVSNPGEKPWIDLTLSWLHRLGGRVSHQNYMEYMITGPLHYKGFEIAIPGDFSSAAFPLAAALITGSPLTVENIDMQENQGDKKIIEILRKMGARFEIEERKKSLKVCRGSSLMGMTIDVNDTIDALPILAVLGCFSAGATKITNGAIARKKESDRIHAIALELQKMGANLEEKEDGLIIHSSPLSGAKLYSHADHRIAIALAVAALGAKGESHIEGVECIKKSYPTFVADFQKLGAYIYE